MLSAEAKTLTIAAVFTEIRVQNIYYTTRITLAKHDVQVIQMVLVQDRSMMPISLKIGSSLSHTLQIEKFHPNPSRN